ncbi:hypothetical protein [Noviherbaspirillum galbum]|uniref:Uncharacterized protein n=1 Tax=Noviherbaspirillum galbum TaxID=2709383 RepID=A0A6B3SIX0_9BURK|nr:hypothetical protein [Noviherbaspirillum galbum]NEX60640.1 hypothetical protein [Noviherbaspirillum galbum]
MSKTKIHYPEWKERGTGAAPSASNASGTPRRDIGYWELVDAITLSAEVCGQVLSRAAAEMLADDLGGFGEDDVLAALARCRLELNGPLRIADIILRMEDGRPSPEEAWAMVPRDETVSVVWTDEVANAWGLALPLIEQGEQQAARSVFQEAYAKGVVEARMRREPVHWMPSLGSDPLARERVLREAVAQGRLTVAHADLLLNGSDGSAAADDGLFAGQADATSLH